MTKTIFIDIELKQNATTKRATFRGCAYVDAGFLVGTITQASETLSTAEKVFLTAFTLTGCPLAARQNGGVLNPWRLTDGQYSGERYLSGPGFTSKSRIVARRDANTVRMNLSVDYTGTLPEFVGVAKPFQEAFERSMNGDIQGTFEISFITESGDVVAADARSRYQLEIDSDCPAAWRNITILARPNTQSLLQIEQIDLFGDKDQAEADLSGKKGVLASLPQSL